MYVARCQIIIAGGVGTSLHKIMSTSFSTLIIFFVVICKPWRHRKVASFFFFKQHGLFFVVKSKTSPCLAASDRTSKVSCQGDLGNGRTAQEYGRKENVSKVNSFVFRRLLNFYSILCFPFIISFFLSR